MESGPPLLKKVVHNYWSTKLKDKTRRSEGCRHFFKGHNLGETNFMDRPKDKELIRLITYIIKIFLEKFTVYSLNS